jgi:hypothetical protein
MYLSVWDRSVEETQILSNDCTAEKFPKNFSNKSGMCIMENEILMQA